MSRRGRRFGLALALACLPAAARAQDAAAPEIVANEQNTLTQIRSFISAEAAYQSANDGLYDTMACLAEPWSCIPGYSRDWPRFLSATDVSLADRDGYRRQFHAGPQAPRIAEASPSSLRACAYTAVPIAPGKTGRRGFCGDMNGMVCEAADGSQPPVKDGQCEPCTPVRTLPEPPPEKPIEAIGRVELPLPPVPTGQAGITKLALVSDGRALAVQVTASMDIKPMLATIEYPTVCLGLITLEVDADHDAASGGLSSYEGKRGYEFEVGVSTCVAYDNEGGSQGAEKPKHTGYYSAFTTKRFTAGSTNTDSVHDVYWKSPRTPIGERTMETSVPYAEMGLKPGQKVRISIIPFPDVLLTLK